MFRLFFDCSSWNYAPIVFHPASTLRLPFDFVPRYWIPRKSFREDVSFKDDKPISGIDSSTASITVNDKSVPAFVVPSSFNSELAGFVKVEFKSLDQWLEEQSLIFAHPKDPFHRVDVLPSGRQVKIEIDGIVLADTGSEGGVMSLWETNFPPRWYLPRTAVCDGPLEEEFADPER
jgi:Domain of unknown function (DUF427)